MHLIRGLQNLQQESHGSVVTIGNYDGIHLGHQAVLRELKAQALALKLPAIAVIFEPQSREYFLQCKSNCRLMTLREKLIALKEHGIDKVLCLRFNAKLANFTANDFVQKLLLEKLKVKELYVGDDFVFGHERRGDIKFLQDCGKKFAFAVHAVPALRLNGVRVSSTLIRQALEKGDLSHAEKLLGKPYSILGKVIHGDKRARALGYPTANIGLDSKIIPKAGVYVVKVCELQNLSSSSQQYGVANVGFRPTVGDNKRLLEVFIFDFNADIYGKLLKVEFIHFLREETKFANFELLQQQIIEDVKEAEKFLCMNYGAN